MAHYQSLEPIKHEEILFQIPVQTTNISIVQSGSPDQMVNYAPIVHTFPAQTDSYIYDVESAAPMILLTPITPPSGTQLTTHESQPSNSNVAISSHGSNVFNEVSSNSVVVVVVVFNFEMNLLLVSN